MRRTDTSGASLACVGWDGKNLEKSQQMGVTEYITVEKKDKHEQGVGFIVHKDVVKSVIGCRPISSRLMTVRLRASPSSITIIQVYVSTSSYDDSEGDEFYRELQSLVDQIPKQDILVVQGDWNAKVGEDVQEDWGEVCGSFCNPDTNGRGLKLLDFATYSNLVLANTLGNHKPSKKLTWHNPDRTHHNQTDYILVKKRFRSGIKTARTRTFPGADVRKRPWHGDDDFPDTP